MKQLIIKTTETKQEVDLELIIELQLKWFSTTTSFPAIVFLSRLLILFWLKLHKYEAKTVRVIILQRFRLIDFIRKKIIAVKSGRQSAKG